MKYRKLGRSGLKVSEMGLGCNPLGAAQPDEKEAIRILDAAVELGINLFDTADVYYEGRVEEILGKGIKTWQRDRVVVVTKVQARTSDDPNGMGLSRKHILTSVEQSLRRLQTDYIDIYLAHHPDPDTPFDETLETLNDLVRAGKVRYIGCSNFPAWETCKALWASSERRLARFDCVEQRYNIVTRSVEQEILPLCVSEGLGVIAFNLLAGGLLTGKYNKNTRPPEDARFGLPDMGKRYRARYWYDRNFEAVDKLREIASEYNHTLAQIATAWVLNHQTVSCGIVGVTSIDQLKQNLSALEISMSPEETKACDQIWESMLPPGLSKQIKMNSVA